MKGTFLTSSSFIGLFLSAARGGFFHALAEETSLSSAAKMVAFALSVSRWPFKTMLTYSGVYPHSAASRLIVILAMCIRATTSAVHSWGIKISSLLLKNS